MLAFLLSVTKGQNNPAGRPDSGAHVDGKHNGCSTEASSITTALQQSPGCHLRESAGTSQSAGERFQQLGVSPTAGLRVRKCRLCRCGPSLHPLRAATDPDTAHVCTTSLHTNQTRSQANKHVRTSTLQHRTKTSGTKVHVMNRVAKANEATNGPSLSDDNITAPQCAIGSWYVCATQRCCEGCCAIHKMCSFETCSWHWAVPKTMVSQAKEPVTCLTCTACLIARRLLRQDLEALTCSRMT